VIIVMVIWRGGFVGGLTPGNARDLAIGDFQASLTKLTFIFLLVVLPVGNVLFVGVKVSLRRGNKRARR
jgi:hypothetical protein